MELGAFKAGADESEWFNWDVVARALGIIKGEDGKDGNELFAILLNQDKVENAFFSSNWPKVKGRYRRSINNAEK